MDMPSGVTSRSAHSGCGILGKAYLVVRTATASTCSDCITWKDSCSMALSIPPR